jgi:hypothetical protein
VVDKEQHPPGDVATTYCRNAARMERNSVLTSLDVVANVVVVVAREGRRHNDVDVLAYQLVLVRKPQHLDSRLQGCPCKAHYAITIARHGNDVCHGCSIELAGCKRGGQGGGDAPR